MTKYKILNAKVYNSQLNKLKSGLKNGNDETNFPHKTLLTNTQVLRLRNGLSANIKSRTLIYL